MQRTHGNFINIQYKIHTLLFLKGILIPPTILKKVLILLFLEVHSTPHLQFALAPTGGIVFFLPKIKMEDKKHPKKLFDINSTLFFSYF